MTKNKNNNHMKLVFSCTIGLFKWFKKEITKSHGADDLAAQLLLKIPSSGQMLCTPYYSILDCILPENGKVNKLANELWGNFPDGWD